MPREEEPNVMNKPPVQGFNAKLPDAPHGSNLFAHFVLYQERRIQFPASPTGPASMDIARRQGEWNRAADAGRSLQ